MNQLFGLQHRGDRYLSHSSRHTQVPVPTAILLHVTHDPRRALLPSSIFLLSCRQRYKNFLITQNV